jgi:hypothetical protein
MNPSTIELDNGVVVEVTRMAESDMLRAASIFDPEKAERLSTGKDVNPRDLMEVWRGNERYLMYIVECSCRLMSPLPPDPIPGRIRRHSDLYGVVADDLVFQEYLEAVYIRYVGMTSEEFIAAVSTVAMGVESKADDKPAPRGRRGRLVELANEGNVQTGKAA